MLTVNNPLPATAQPHLIDPDATCGLSKRAKARIAVDVLNGTAAFKWTVPALAKLLGVCASYIQQQKKTASLDLQTTWQRTSEAERDAFLRTIQGHFWATFAAPVPRPKSLGNGHALTEARRHPRVIHAHVAQ